MASASTSSGVDVGDTCTWYSGGSCHAPRSCYDCLNTLLPGGTCGIHLATGGCASLSTLVGGAQYSSQNSTYCERDDDTCGACANAWLDSYLHTDSPPAMDAACIGADGCVCIAGCSRPTRVSIIVDENCQLFGSQATRILAFGAVGIGVCFCFALVALFTHWVLNRFAPDSMILPPRSEQLARRRRARRIPRREPSGPQLNLNGWKAMREQLIQSEHTSLSQPGVVVDADGDGGSSDEGGEHLAGHLVVNATVVTVEQGDAYRPLSPSQLHTARLPNLA